MRAEWRSWLAGILLGMCAAGCKGPQGPPHDPLFANHKPQETKAEQAAPVAIAFAEPEAPADPVALAKGAAPKTHPLPTDQPRGNVPGILTGRPAPAEKLPETVEPPR